MQAMTPRSNDVRLATLTAVAGTVFIAAGAFWLSFTSLSDLARRSGVDAGQAWMWPLIVDGIIVVATVAAVALTGTRGAWYPWMLLVAGAGISVAANAIHAVVAETTEVPLVLAACVASVPPMVLLAITHLTSVLMGSKSSTQPDTRHITTSTAPARAVAKARRALPPADATSPPIAIRDDASSLRSLGWSNAAIAKKLGVHPSTIGRWLSDHVGAPSSQTDTLREGASDG